MGQWGHSIFYETLASPILSGFNLGNWIGLSEAEGGRKWPD